MKKIIFAAFAVSGLFLSAADIKLPAPDKSGGITLNAALNARKTCRKYEAKELTPAQISQLLWSGFGINRADGRRTAPTAVNRQEITLYLLTAKGAFLYNAKAGSLVQKSSSDLRKFAGRFSAPCYIILVSDIKLTGTSARARHFAVMDIGYVSQNLYLAAAAGKLGTCAIGSMTNPKALSAALKLPATQEILLAHSVGIPKK